MEAELKAEEYYADILIHFVLSKATKTEIHDKAKEYGEALKKYTHFADTFTFLFFAHTVYVLQYEIINDHKNVIIECQQKPLRYLNKSLLT